MPDQPDGNTAGHPEPASQGKPGSSPQPVNESPPLAQPRPLPDSIETIPDLLVRQRAADAWRAASQLRRLMEQWGTWVWQLVSTGDADPGLALCVAEAAATCVRALVNLEAQVPTILNTPIGELLRWFPDPPDSRLDPPWQKDQTYLKQTRELLRSKGWVRLQGELLGFTQLLEIAPSAGVSPPSGERPKGPRSRGLGGKTQGKEKPRRKRGRPADTKPEADRRLNEAWQTGSFPTYAALAREKKITEYEVKKAIDRHRKRVQKDGT